jgi:DNA modification methylase
LKKPIEYIVDNAINLKGILKKKKSDNVDLIITSPPYYDVKNYNNNELQIGYRQTYTEYLEDIVKVIQSCYDISKDSATLWMVVDTIQRNGETIMLPYDINQKLKNLYKDKTWKLKDIIIWNKYKNVPWCSKGRLKNQIEYILFYSKSENYKYNIDKIREFKDYKKWWKSYPERYNSKGKSPTNLWEFTIPIRGWGNGYQQHLCPFPFPLIERIISLSTDEGDLIFDPFAGSGSVLALAGEMNRKAIGIDVNSTYKDRYEAEVIIGAKKYWEKRKLEIDLNDTGLTEFKRLNKKLRKIKAGVELKSKLENIKPGIIEKIFTNERNSKTNEIECYFIGKSNMLNLTSIVKKLDIEDIEKKYKVKINYKYAKISEFINEFGSEKKYYAYLPKKIYKYHKMMDLSYILNNLNGEYLYSNIKINIKS